MHYLKKLKILSKYKYIIIVLLAILLALIRSNRNISSKYNITDNKFEGIIIDYKYDKDKISFTLNANEKIRCNFYINDLNFVPSLNYGDKVNLTGELSIPSNNTIPNTFNYKKYLFNNGINYTLNVVSIDKQESSKNYLYIIKNKIQKRIKNIDDSGYLSMFILGNKNYLDNDIYKSYKSNGIIHIFSISGMHISLLASVILFILNNIKKSNINIFLVIIFLILYLIITNYQASIVRSIVFYILLHIFKLKDIKIDTSNILLLSISLILLIYPKYIYNIGFLYSSVISFSLIYFNKFFNKGYFINILLISLVSFFVSLPITINNNYCVNFLSIIINMFFVPIISFIIYPLSIITFFFPALINIFKVFINLIETLSLFLNKITFFQLALPKINIIEIAIYYSLLFYLSNKDKKYYIFLFMYVIFIKSIPLVDYNAYVYFLDVGQGDMTVIKYKTECIIIDTGPKNYNSNYEVGESLIVFLNSIGITDVDLLVLSHGDSDHIGNANYLIKNFKIKRIMINDGNINNYEKQLPKEKIVSEYNSRLNFIKLNHNLCDDENCNSIVNYLDIFNTKILFMGDAPKSVEKELLNKYNLKIDIIKLGHHGSKTSSDYDFLKKIDPDYAIISSGRKNIYKHPSLETLKTLKNLKINYYNTQSDGTIYIKISKKNRTIFTNAP